MLASASVADSSVSAFRHTTSSSAVTAFRTRVDSVALETATRCFATVAVGAGSEWEEGSVTFPELRMVVSRSPAENRSRFFAVTVLSPGQARESIV